MQINISVAGFVFTHLRGSRGEASACASRPEEGVKVKEVRVLMGLRRLLIMQTFIYIQTDKDKRVAAIDLSTLTDLDRNRRKTIVLKTVFGMDSLDLVCSVQIWK